MYSVVIVDDDQETALRLKNRLSWKKWHCNVAALEKNGNQAYEIIKQIKPQVVITEIPLKGMDGLDLIRRLEGECFPHACIIVSEYENFKWAQKGIELGVRGYLLKPVEEDDMEEAIMRAVKQITETFLASTDQKHDLEEDEIDIKLKEIERAGTDFSLPIRTALSYVETNLYTSFTMSMLCDHLGMSQSYISRLFKKETGVGFSDYLRMSKMSRARTLLKDPKNKVYQVATLLGYQDYTYFYKVFKGTFGYPPTALRAGEDSGTDTAD